MGSRVLRDKYTPYNKRDIASGDNVGPLYSAAVFSTPPPNTTMACTSWRFKSSGVMGLTCGNRCADSQMAGKISVVRMGLRASSESMFFPVCLHV
jgi:hypothetical protein